MKQHSKSGRKFKKIIPKLTLNPTYYNLNKFFSYPELFMGMIDGGRGIGKTTSAFIKAIINSNKGEEFIYLRRYKPEIKDFVNQDSLSPIVDGIRYRGDGTGGYMCYYEDHKIGNLIALSTSRSYKSVDFSKVTLIIFDEIQECPNALTSLKYFSLPLKLTPIASTSFSKALFDFPGILFCSCIKVFIFKLCAAFITG